jgi:hypothetical protein
MFCPNCDYSREGMLDGAACPECGMRCDSSVIILQDDIGEESEPESKKRWRWLWFVVIGVGGALLLASDRRDPLSTLVWLVPAIVFLTIALWNNIFSSRRSHLQLWMHERGFELLPSTDAARKSRPLLRRAVIYLPLCIFAAPFLRRESLAGAWFALAFVLPIALALWLQEWGRVRNPRRVDVAIGDFQRQLIPWHALNRCDIRQPAEGRVQTRFNWTVPVIGRLFTVKESVRLEAPCDPERYAALQHQVHRWRAADWTRST